MSTPQQPNSMVYTQAFGSSPLNVQTPHLDIRAPASSDVLYPVGKRWVDTLSNATYTLTSFSSSQGITSANWEAEGGGATSVATLSGDTGTAVPTAGNIQIAGGAGVTTSATGSVVTVALSGGGQAIDSFIPDAGTNPVVPAANGSVTMAGTTNQITTTGGLNTLTWSIPTTFIAPGSIESTTTITSGTGITATTGDITATAGDVIATVGDITATAGAVSAGTTVTGGTGVTATTGDVTATAGDLVATAGDLSLNGATSKISINVTAPTTASAGTATLNGSGTVTVSTSAVTADSLIFVTINTPTNPGVLSVPSASIVAGTQFVINSESGTDASTVNYWIIN